jgi:cell division protein FtsB
MRDEVSRLTELVAAYRSGAGVLPPSASGTDAASDADASDSAPAAAWGVPGDYLRKSDLEAATAALTEELASLESRVAGLEDAAVQLAGLEAALRTGVAEGFPAATGVSAQPGELAGGTTGRAAAESALADAESAADAAGLTAQLADLTRQNEALRREVHAMESRILADILDNGLVAMMREQLTVSIQDGLSGALPDVGDWSVSGDRALQADSDAYFAKLALPVPQGNEPTLYSFQVRSLDPSGWVGVGLHFNVRDVEKRRGYGMGKSLLVWLTRDPDVYKNQLTYLQLYRSDDDINMGRVLDAVIEEPISRFVTVEVLYEPDREYITVAIDGEDKIRYRTWFGIYNGIEVALRSLGAAEFTDFRINRAPE